jgi:hypothetical protein
MMNQGTRWVLLKKSLKTKILCYCPYNNKGEKINFFINIFELLPVSGVFYDSAVQWEN